MTGYKIFTKDWKSPFYSFDFAANIKNPIGASFHTDEKAKLGVRGFHFYTSLMATIENTPHILDYKVCEITTVSAVIIEPRGVSSDITIIREILPDELDHAASAYIDCVTPDIIISRHITSSIDVKQSKMTQYSLHIDNSAFINGSSSIVDSNYISNSSKIESSGFIHDCQHIITSKFARHTDHAQNCTMIEGCSDIKNSKMCINCAFSNNLYFCNNCLLCINLTHKDAHLFNKPASYARIKKITTELRNIHFGNAQIAYIKSLPEYDEEIFNQL